MSFDISALSSRFTVRRLNDSDAPALQGTVPPILNVSYTINAAIIKFQKTRHLRHLKTHI